MGVFEEGEFEELTAKLVAAEAPRLFAVVHEVGDQEDGWIAAWGMAFEDHASVVCDDGLSMLKVASADRARHLLDEAPDRTAHLVWVKGDE